MSDHEIDALLNEARVFPPSAEWRSNALVNDPSVYARAAADPEAFWAGFASELEWIEPWSKVLDWQPPNAKWFVGGRLNVSANCLDRHLRTARRNKAALIWEGEPGDRRTLTYFDLHRQVSQFANVLKTLGIKKGERVALYMPLVPELAIVPAAPPPPSAEVAGSLPDSAPRSAELLHATSNRHAPTRRRSVIAAEPVATDLRQSSMSRAGGAPHRSPRKARPDCREQVAAVRPTTWCCRHRRLCDSRCSTDRWSRAGRCTPQSPRCGPRSSE